MDSAWSMKVMFTPFKEYNVELFSSPHLVPVLYDVLITSFPKG